MRQVIKNLKYPHLILTQKTKAMNMLRKLFTSKNSSMNSNHSETSSGFDDKQLEKMENLFVNNEEPEEQQEKEKNNLSPLEKFMERDFYDLGFQNGYNYHSSEEMKGRELFFKSEFRNLLTRKIMNYKAEIRELNERLLEIEGMDRTLEKILSKRIEIMQQQCEEIEAEKSLSSIDEGIIMECIHLYRSGFKRGTKLFLDEKSLHSPNSLFD